MSKRKTGTEEVSAEPDVSVEDDVGLDIEAVDEGQPVGVEAEIEQALRAELEQVQEEAQENKDKYLRAVAEMENTRRRAESDVANARKFGVESFAAEALSVRDSIELARAIEIDADDPTVLKKIQEGLDLTLKQLDAVFSKFNIQVVDPAPGDKLDPERHQAMSIQESADIPPKHIVTVIQKGYTIHDRLLRPAMVIVAKEITEKQPETSDQNTRNRVRGTHLPRSYSLKSFRQNIAEK